MKFHGGVEMKKITDFRVDGYTIPLTAFPMFDMDDNQANLLIMASAEYKDPDLTSPHLDDVIWNVALMIGGMLIEITSRQLFEKITVSLNGSESLIDYISNIVGFDCISEEAKVALYRVWIVLLLDNYYKGVAK